MRAQADAVAGDCERGGLCGGCDAAKAGDLSSKDPCVVRDEQDDRLLGGTGGEGTGISPDGGAGGRDEEVTGMVREPGDKALTRERPVLAHGQSIDHRRVRLLRIAVARSAGGAGRRGAYL